MQKVQKTYTAECKREAVQLAETSGKPIAQVARELGIDFHVNPSVAQRVDRAWPRSISWQWPSGRSGRGAAPPQTGVGEDAKGARYIKKSARHLFATPALN